MKGFTLIEVLIALGILSLLGSMACLATFDQYLHSTATFRQRDTRDTLLRARAQAMAGVAQVPAALIFAMESGAITSVASETQVAWEQNGALGD